MTLPLVLILALVIAHLTGETGGARKSTKPPPPITLAAPPHAAANTVACTKVLAELPVSLNGLAGRFVVTHPDTPFVVAWGDPAVIWRCGVDRPSSLHQGSTAQYFAGGDVQTGPWYDITKSGSANVWTTVDRSVYMSIEVPGRYHADPVVTLSKAIAAALPAVCSTDPTIADVTKLCTRRP